MQFILGGLFDWVQFSTDRIKNPLVITGLAIVLLGIISALIANPINNTQKVQELATKQGKSDVFFAGVLRLSGYALIIIGCILMAVVK